MCSEMIDVVSAQLTITEKDGAFVHDDTTPLTRASLNKSPSPSARCLHTQLDKSPVEQNETWRRGDETGATAPSDPPTITNESVCVAR